MRRFPVAVAGSLVVVIMVTVTLVGCGQQSHTTAITAGGTVTIVPSPYGRFTRNFNPFLTQTNVGCSGTGGLIYESLVAINRLDGTAQPWLAQRFSWSADVTTLTFTLRSGITWTDGYPLTSQDVAFTFDILRHYPSLDTGQVAPDIRRIDTPDAATVRITFAAPSPNALWYLGGQTFIVPKHIWSAFPDPATATNPNPIGTGPFVLQSFTPALYVLMKNEHYWQPGKPYVSAVRFPAYDSNTGAGVLLAQGDIDWLGVYAPYIQQVFVGLDPAHNHYWFPPISVVMLYLNLTRAPFNQLAVRQAISLAIHRDALSTQAESGYEPPAHPAAVLPGFAHLLASQYALAAFTANSSKAMSLLAQAGYQKNAEGVAVDAAGQPLTFTLNVVSGWTDWVAMAKLIASDLAEIGIAVHVQTMDYPTYLSSLQMGGYDAAISWTASGPSPYFLYNGLLNSANSASVGHSALSNWERWTDPNSDRLLAQYAGTTDATTQQTALAGLEQVMVERLPAIPLTDGVSWYEYSTARFIGWPTADDPYSAPSPYSYPDNEMVLLHIHKP
jgi:peptide/nickel transport system substrate-binding protein